ncbi:MICA1 monooxygenase, partial [Amia calva]|nr:MICA1 monooxygenase [Amia calva]
MTPHETSNRSHELFDRFLQGQRCKDVLLNFSQLCQHLEVDPSDYRNFYVKLKERLNYWRAKALWAKLDKRASHQDYQQGHACAKNKCLVLGAGPCGLRTAIELAFMGAKVVLIEKRDTFSRNNVLHLWPYTIHDLRGLAAKKFYGKFCSGSLDHIKVHTCVEYKGLIEPQRGATGLQRHANSLLSPHSLIFSFCHPFVNGVHSLSLLTSLSLALLHTGWHADICPESHPAAQFQFDVFISAGGGRFVPEGFKRKELRGKLAIGITANFVNHHTAAEGQVSEISGVARIYNQKFFQSLLNETGIDLENIVYYKDDTHYFVMTAKKKSLLTKGVIKQDDSDAEKLLSPANVNAEALRRYAYEAAHFSTNKQLPGLEFALNHASQPDVAMFDFTCMYRAETASLVRERHGHRLLVGLVGDCLVEPFWPLGTGIARGFLAAFDAAWMVRRWGQGTPPLEVMAERESIYQLLSQTTPENTSKNYNAYSIDPTTRYPNINLHSIKPKQVQHLYDVGDQRDGRRPSKKPKEKLPHLRQDSIGGCEELLAWCQQHTAGYKRVKVTDLTHSWKSGLALCALIHRFKPHLIDFTSLDETNTAYNNQLAFDMAERELGITPIMSGSDMAAQSQPDKLAMVLYLTQFYNAFQETAPPPDPDHLLSSSKPVSLSTTKSAIFFLSKLKHNSLQRRKEKMSAEKDAKERCKMSETEVSVSFILSDIKRVSLWCYFQSLSCQEQLTAMQRRSGQTSPGSPCSSDLCYFCGNRVYVLERVSTEGKFFHRSCFTCHQCGITLHLGSYSFQDKTDQPSLPENVDHSISSRTDETVQESSCKDSEGTPRGEDHVVLPPLPTARTDDILETTEREATVPDCVTTVIGSSDEQQEDSGTRQPPAPAVRTSLLKPGPGGPGCPPVPKPRIITPKTPAVSFPNENESQSTKRQDDHTPPEDDQGGQMSLTGEDQSLPQASPESHLDEGPPKPTMKKLQLTEEEKSQLISLNLVSDADAESQHPGEPPSGDQAKGPPTLLIPSGCEEQLGIWTGPRGSVREQTNRRSFRRKEVQPEQPTAQPPAQLQLHPNHKPKPKFSPWNLSSPRLGREHRDRGAPALDTQEPEFGLSEGEDEEEEDDDEDVFNLDEEDFLFNEKAIPDDPVEAQKLELMKMRTLERRVKLCEMQRFHKAQSIQRRLEEIEVTFKDLEEKGVILERALRGESGSGGSPEMIDQWIQLVQEKNALVSEESDLMVASRQLELEDKQTMLEKEFRRYIEMDDSKKTAQDRAEEERVLAEMVEVVDMRNSLVTFLEEKRLKEINECLHGLAVLDPKRPHSGGAQVHWE